MKERIELPQEVCGIIEVLEAHGFEAYAVGGAVRDMLIGVPPGDFDVTTSAQPEEVKALFPRTIDTGIAHGTVTVMKNGTGYEVTTYRIDGKYSDARHPESVEFTRSLREDLKRRDFTVNAMAYNPKTGLVDLFEGREDLTRGIIRAVGDPEERFREDALRILRCVRFAAQLGFTIEEKTLEAAGKLAGNLRMISRERIREELLKILVSGHPERIGTLWEISGQMVFGGLRTAEDEALREMGLPEEKEILRMIRILTELPGERVLRLSGYLTGLSGRTLPEKTAAQFAACVLSELKFDNDTKDAVVRLAGHCCLSPSLSKTEVRKLTAELGFDETDRLITLRKAVIRADGGDGAVMDTLVRYRTEIEAAGDCVRMKDLKISGKDLIRMGLKPGKAMGEVLKQLFEAVLEKPALNTEEILKARARQLLDGNELR